MRIYQVLKLGVCLGLLGGSATASAQPLGTFRWQLQQYCNVVTLNVTGQGAVFTLDGFDDQCGASQRASVVGTAFFNPDGSVGIGLNTVLAPGGAFVHVDARIDLGSLGGPWRDSAGNSGTFVFTPGASTGGPLRPVALNGIAPGSITSAQIAPGVVGTGQIDPSQVQARVGGSCPVGQYLRGINANGTVICEPLPLPVTADEAFHIVGTSGEPTFGNGGLGDCLWQNFPPGSGLLAAANPVSFYKDSDGIVHLAGAPRALNGPGGDMTCDTGTDLSDAVIFQLPPGYRPEHLEIFVSGNTTIGLNFVAPQGGLIVDGTFIPGGSVFVANIADGNGTLLDGFTFRVATGTTSGSSRAPASISLEALRDLPGNRKK